MPAARARTSAVRNADTRPTRSCVSGTLSAFAAMTPTSAGGGCCGASCFLLHAAASTANAKAVVILTTLERVIVLVPRGQAAKVRCRRTSAISEQWADVRGSRPPYGQSILHDIVQIMTRVLQVRRKQRRRVEPDCAGVPGTAGPLRITRIQFGFCTESPRASAGICHSRGVSFRALPRPVRALSMNAQSAVPIPTAAADTDPIFAALAVQLSGARLRDAQTFTKEFLRRIPAE